MISTPLVSVILPVYNGEAFLREAIESILNQTYQPIELIVIDDGSTDNTPTILKDYEGKIRHYRQSNQGLVKTLNLGLSLANGKYIARMDADDISHPQRLEKQINYLEANPDVNLLGTSCYYINFNGKIIGRGQVPRTNGGIKWVLLFASPFIHPSVIIKKDFIFNNGLLFNEKFPYAEDYELWGRILKNSKAANLPEPLISYRIHQKNISIQNKNIQLYFHKIISKNILQDTFPNMKIINDDIEALCELSLTGFRNINKLKSKQQYLMHTYLNIWIEFEKRYIFESLDEARENALYHLLIMYISTSVKKINISYLKLLKNHFPNIYCFLFSKFPFLIYKSLQNRY